MFIWIRVSWASLAWFPAEVTGEEGNLQSSEYKVNKDCSLAFHIQPFFSYELNEFIVDAEPHCILHCTPLGFPQAFQSPSRDTCPITRSLSRKTSQTTALSSWEPQRIWICSHTQPLWSNLETAVSVCSSTMHPSSVPDRQEWLQKEKHHDWKRWVPATKKTKWCDTGQVETAFQKQ